MRTLEVPCKIQREPSISFVRAGFEYGSIWNGLSEISGLSAKVMLETAVFEALTQTLLQYGELKTQLGNCTCLA